MPNADGSPSAGEPGYSAPGGLIQAAGAPVSPDKTVTGYTAATAAPSTATSQGYTSTPTSVVNADTVAGTLKNIISDDSPLMQQATTRARQDMNSRGLLNSSLAVGAGENAVIAQALPMAQQDAATNFTANQKTVDAQNAAAQFGANAGNTAALTNSQLTTQTNNANAGLINAASAQTSQAANQLQLGYLNQATQVQLGQLSSDTQKTLGTLSAQNQQLLQTNSSAATMFSNVVTALANIAANKDMTQAAKDAATTTQINMLNQGLQQQATVSATVPAAVTGLNLSQYFGGNTAIAAAHSTPSNPAQTQDNFNPQAYLAANPDVANDPYYAGNPYQHWLDHGQSEGRAFPYVTPPASA